jgi:DNA-3-methyladenine glycosylase
VARRLRRLRRAELPVDTVELARFLIGKAVVRELPDGRLSGRIVETEAYLPGDAACHAFRGKTQRNASLFLEHGHAYVYFCYGSAFMLNVAGERAGVGAGVLLRALEPLGPGRLAAALCVDRRLDGLDLCKKGPIWLATGAGEAGPVGESVRIGLTKDAERVLRFFERGNPHVSGPRSLSASSSGGRRGPSPAPRRAP